MKIIEPGHIYQLQHLDGSGAGMLVFVNREAGTEHEGTQTQEILRALIDRTQHCDSCLRWDGNDKIIHHLRMALSLHEARALERKTEKGELQPENVKVGSDGHFITVSSERVAMFGIGRIVACQHVLWHEADRCRHNLPMGTTCAKCLRECATCWDDCAERDDARAQAESAAIELNQLRQEVTTLRGERSRLVTELDDTRVERSRLVRHENETQKLRFRIDALESVIAELRRRADGHG